jgi:hypothetical protein
MIELTISLFNGSVHVVVRGDDTLELIRLAAFYSQLPRECPVCGAPVHFTYRTPQDFEYYGLACRGEPRHETSFGQYKGGKGLFYKATWRKAGQPDDADGCA